MTYPSRGAWLFHNVTRDFDFWPTLDSISIAEAQPLDVATFSCSVVDTAGTLTFDNEDEVWVKFAGTRVFAGHLKTVEEEQVSEVGPRRYSLAAQDYTAKLDDSVIDYEPDRHFENLPGRLAWILGFLNYGLTATAIDVPDEECEKAPFGGSTVREALQQEADEHRLAMYVDFGKDIHIFRSETVSAPFDLDDTAPDYSTSFPYREYRRSRDSVELTTAAYVRGEKTQTWITDPEAIDTWGRQERAVDDSGLATQQARERAGNRALAENNKPILDGRLVCFEPGLRGGMTAHLVNDLWGIDGNVVLVSVDISAVDPHDADGTAYLRSEVSFSDRRKARPSHRHVINKLSRKRHPHATTTGGGDPVDPIIDEFDREWSGPSWGLATSGYTWGDDSSSTYVNGLYGFGEAMGGDGDRVGYASLAGYPVEAPVETLWRWSPHGTTSEDADVYFFGTGTGDGLSVHLTHAEADLPAGPVWRYTRIRYSGGEGRIRTWLDGDVEPATWDSVVTVAPPAALSVYWIFHGSGVDYGRFLLDWVRNVTDTPLVESSRGAPGGVAPLNEEMLVPSGNLGSGTADATTFLRGDGAWAVPAGTGGGGGPTTGQFVVGFEGSPPDAGHTQDVIAPADGTITGWTLLGDAAGDGVVDIWRDDYASFPPTIADSITASAKPTLSAADAANSTALTGWSTSISAGDVLRFHLDSASGLSQLLLVLDYARA